MKPQRTAWPWLPFGCGLLAGLVLTVLLTMIMAYPTPVVDLLQALDFSFG